MWTVVLIVLGGLVVTAIFLMVVWKGEQWKPARNRRRVLRAYRALDRNYRAHMRETGHYVEAEVTSGLALHIQCTDCHPINFCRDRSGTEPIVRMVRDSEQ